LDKVACEPYVNRTVNRKKSMKTTCEPVNPNIYLKREREYIYTAYTLIPFKKGSYLYYVGHIEENAEIGFTEGSRRVHEGSHGQETESILHQ
jgi:hypothetical protein